jgi:TP901-1 family phage major tail protein
MAKLQGYLSRLAESSDGGTTYVNVAGIQEISFGGPRGTIDITNKDSGAYKEFMAGRLEYKLSASGFFDAADPGQAALWTAKEAGSTIKLRFRPTVSAGTVEYILSALVTDIEDTSPNDGALSIKYTFQPTGSPTVQNQS